jgi:hypothetical protein
MVPFGAQECPCVPERAKQRKELRANSLGLRAHYPNAMDALSQLSYTPVTVQDDLQMVWQTSIILTNINMKFHCDELLVAGQVRAEEHHVSPLRGFLFVVGVLSHHSRGGLRSAVPPGLRAKSG